MVRLRKQRGISGREPPQEAKANADLKDLIWGRNSHERGLSGEKKRGEFSRRGRWQRPKPDFPLTAAQLGGLAGSLGSCRDSNTAETIVNGLW